MSFSESKIFVVSFVVIPMAKLIKSIQVYSVLLKTGSLDNAIQGFLLA